MRGVVGARPPLCVRRTRGPEAARTPAAGCREGAAAPGAPRQPPPAHPHLRPGGGRGVAEAPPRGGAGGVARRRPLPGAVPGAWRGRGPSQGRCRRRGVSEAPPRGGAGAMVKLGVQLPPAGLKAEKAKAGDGAAGAVSAGRGAPGAPGCACGAGAEGSRLCVRGAPGSVCGGLPGAVEASGAGGAGRSRRGWGALAVA